MGNSYFAITISEDWAVVQWRKIDNWKHYQNRVLALRKTLFLTAFRLSWCPDRPLWYIKVYHDIKLYHVASHFKLLQSSLCSAQWLWNRSCCNQYNTSYPLDFLTVGQFLAMLETLWMGMVVTPLDWSTFLQTETSQQLFDGLPRNFVQTFVPPKDRSYWLW